MKVQQMNAAEETRSGEKREKYTFHKSERLRHHSLVEDLYRSGKTIYEFPFRLTWKSLNCASLEKQFRNGVPEGIGKLQMMVTVPKKKRKRAVDRVLLRRRIRAAYRLNRLQLRDTVNNRPEIRSLQLSFVYIYDKNLPYAMIEEKIKVLLNKIIARI